MATIMGWDAKPPRDLEEAVGQAIGAGSVCWEDPGGAGVFQSDRASQIVDELVEWIRNHR